MPLRGGIAEGNVTKGEPQGLAAGSEAPRLAFLRPPPPASQAASRWTLLPSPGRPSKDGERESPPAESRAPLPPSPGASLTSARQGDSKLRSPPCCRSPKPWRARRPRPPTPREPRSRSPGCGSPPVPSHPAPPPRRAARSALGAETRRPAPAAGAAAGHARGAEAGEGGAAGS